MMAFSTSPGLEMLREIDLGFDPFFAARTGARRLETRAACASRRGAQMIRTFSASCSSRELEWRLLLGDPNFIKSVENGFALDFQFPGEIVNSNLTHPAFSYSGCCR